MARGILILDFGPSYPILLPDAFVKWAFTVNCIRTMYPDDFIREYNPEGIIPSGSHASTQRGARSAGSRRVQAGRSVLGICYGMFTP